MLIDANDPKVWADAYSTYLDGVEVHYERLARTSFYGDAYNMLMDAMGLVAGQSVAIIGAGFGWGAEMWHSRGVQTVCADTSQYIQERLHEEAIVPVHDIDITQLGGAQRLLEVARADKFDAILTEDVLPWLTDEGAQRLSAACAFFTPRVVHWVSVDGSAEGYNWKSLAQWKELLPLDEFVARGRSEIV